MKKRHIIITGPGRSGTTFLVQLLTKLHFDTGFTDEYLPIDNQVRAGLEHQGLGPNLPYIIKNPKLMWQLKDFLKNDSNVIIDHVFIPLRDIDAAVRSRLKNIESLPEGIDLSKVWGGLESVNDTDLQKPFFLEKLYEFCLFLGTFNIPVTFLSYPRLVTEAAYLYQKLVPILSGMEYELFENAFKQVAQKTFVHRNSDNDVIPELVYDDTPNKPSSHQKSNIIPVGELQGKIIQYLRNELSQYQNTPSETAVLYYDTGTGLNRTNAIQRNVVEGSETLHFDLSDYSVRRFRFDPANHEVVVRLNYVEITDCDGEKRRLEYTKSNATFFLENVFYFLIPDSQIEFITDVSIASVEISVHYLAMNQLDVFRLSHSFLTDAQNRIDLGKELRGIKFQNLESAKKSGKIEKILLDLNSESFRQKEKLEISTNSIFAIKEQIDVQHNQVDHATHAIDQISNVQNAIHSNLNSLKKHVETLDSIQQESQSTLERLLTFQSKNEGKINSIDESVSFLGTHIQESICNNIEPLQQQILKITELQDQSFQHEKTIHKQFKCHSDILSSLSKKIERQSNHLEYQHVLLSEVVAEHKILQSWREFFRKELMKKARLFWPFFLARRLFSIIRHPLVARQHTKLKRILKNSKLFDSKFYLESHPELYFKATDLVDHFIQNCNRFAPHPLFNFDYYRKQWVVQIPQETSLFFHFIQYGQNHGANPHPLFDIEYYRSQISSLNNKRLDNPLTHFLYSGWKQGLNPHPLFDVVFYLKSNRDVKDAGVNPLIHFVKIGYRENRQPHALFDIVFYKSKYALHSPEINPLIHFLEIGWKLGHNPNANFNTKQYLDTHPELVDQNMNPIIHYLNSQPQ